MLHKENRMANYDADLKVLYGEILHKRDLEIALKDLCQKQDELEGQVAQLKQIKLAEQKDVDKIEKGGLKSFFYGATGRKGKKLDKEREEAFAAAKKYEEALRELEDVNECIYAKEREMESLEADETRYDELLQEKRKQISESGNPSDKKLSDIEEKMSILKESREMIAKTVGTGAQILKDTEDIRAVLNRAEKSAVVQTAFKPMEFDKFFQMGNAQDLAANLKNEMETFGAELKSILGDVEMPMNLDSFYQFGNFIYSYWVKDTATIMDVASIERIRTARGNLKLIDDQVKKGISALEERQQINEKEIILLKNKLEGLIIDAKV